MRQPEIYDAIVIKRWATQVEIEPGRWVPARHASFPGLGFSFRIRAAWLVFTGRCDVLRWEEG